MASATNDLAYDPDQNPEEKRAVRKHYRSLAKVVEEQQTNVNEVTADELTNQVHRADELFDQVKGPQEATLDSRFLLLTSTIGAQKARAMKSGSGAFDMDEFITKLIGFMGGRKQLEEQVGEGDSEEDADDHESLLEWDKIGRKALAKSRRVPALSFMLGPLSIEQKKRGPVKRNKLEKNKEDLKKPQELREEDISRSQNETTKNVAIVEKILEDETKAINIFQLVINPNDFAQSVENIFYLSFLIRDGKASFEMDPDGNPVVMLCEQPSQDDYGQGLQKRQMVLEFDMDVWKRAIDVFNITESKIPPRPKAQTRLGDKWYG